MKDKITNYFLNITDQDTAQHKILVRKVRQETANMLRRECKHLIRQGF